MTNPDGNGASITVRKIGKKAKIFCCMGSGGFGFSFCCTHILRPIAMGVSMWIQQKLNPKPPDPIQQKIFAFFPIFLTVILAPFPSGLVIYWTFNNIFTMIQQYYIQSKMTIKTT